MHADSIISIEKYTTMLSVEFVGIYDKNVTRTAKWCIHSFMGIVSCSFALTYEPPLDGGAGQYQVPLYHFGP